LIGERFELVELLGEGGMGSVYLGRDVHTGASVAIKTIRQHGQDPSAMQRLLLEATSAARVVHPGIVRTLDVDLTSDGTLYLILEFVDGIPLDQRIRMGTMPYGHACRIGAAMADALMAVHAGGVVHRDIKPSNVLLCKVEPGIKLLDFGIAKIFAPYDGPETAVELTHTNQLLGTPAYLAPEQAKSAADISPAADVYALALIVFEMAAGHLPFEAGSALQWLLQHSTSVPRGLREYVAEAPEELCRLLAQALSKDPAERPTAARLRDELTAIADRERVPSAASLALPGRRPSRRAAQAANG
jgi:serine/threonine-protein kinase